MNNNNDFEIGTKLFITGFSINPVKDPQMLHQIIKGLCNYESVHLCDFGNITEHKNYLGDLVGNIKVDYIEEDKFKGVIGFACLTNGYFVLKIYDNVYPAEIQFDLYLNEKMDDAQIILDHLSSPSGPFDGLCIFDYQYSLSYITKPKNILNKYNKNNAPYVVNEAYNSKLHQQSVIENKFYGVQLNELTNPQCYFCKDMPVIFKLYDNPRKIILVCNNHANKEGDITEYKMLSWDNGIKNTIL